MPGNIVMWGAPQSGKSTYLLSLVFWQEHREGHEHERRLALIPANSDTAIRIADMANQYAVERNVSKTSTVQRLSFRLYELAPEQPRWAFLKKPAPAAHIADLTFWDAPGEYFSGPIPDDLMPEIVRADGLMLIVDPTSSDAGQATFDYWTFFHGALGSLKNAMAEAHANGEIVAGFEPSTNRIAYPVALCLSKIDRASNGGRNAQEWLNELLGRDKAFLTGWLKNPQAFSFSATGPASTSADQDPSPRFIMDPLAWLLGRNSAASV